MDKTLSNVPKKQNALQVLVADYGISRTAKKLGYTRAYISQVNKGKMKLTINLRKAIIKFNLKPRHLCAVDMLNAEDKELVQGLDMETRRRVLLKAAKGK